MIEVKKNNIVEYLSLLEWMEYMSSKFIKIQDIEQLEKEIDRYHEELPPLKAFILPSGHPVVSQAHVCRCVCRRAERLVVALNETEKTDMMTVRYLNRLSDYLFTLSRYYGLKLGVTELEWKGLS